MSTATTGQILLIPAWQIPCVAETRHMMPTVLAVISTKCMSILSADVGPSETQLILGSQSPRVELSQLQ